MQCQATRRDTLVEVLRAERPDQAIVFVRTKIRCDQLFRRLRDRGLNVKALHGDMSPGPARRRHALVQGRPRADPRGHRRRRARPGHLDRHPRRQLRRPDEPRRLRAPHRAHRPRRALRARASPSSSRASGASSRPSSATSGPRSRPWSAGAHVAPAPVAERPRRHSKPHLSRNGDEPYAKLIAGVGRAEGVEVADLVHAVTGAAGLDGEAVRDVRVLERFSFLSVPRSEAERVVEAVDGTRDQRDRRCACSWPAAELPRATGFARGGPRVQR